MKLYEIALKEYFYRQSAKTNLNLKFPKGGTYLNRILLNMIQSGRKLLWAEIVKFALLDTHLQVQSGANPNREKECFYTFPTQFQVCSLSLNWK